MDDMKILICDPLDEEGIRRLKDAGYNVNIEANITPTNLVLEVVNYDALIVRSRTRINKVVLDHGKKLKIVVRAGVGLDNIDVKYAKNKGVTVFNTPEALSNAVAELVIGLIFVLSRGICKGHMSLRSGEWMKKKLIGQELKNRKLGILGLGRIGKEVANKALCLGMNVSAYDIVGINEEYKAKGVEEMNDPKDVFISSDYVSLHVPLLPQTYHMVNRELLSLMKPTAYLINTSRGELIDSKALIEFLRENRLAGAGLDVFETEPPVGSELLTMDNVVLTPHIGAQSREAQKEASKIAAEKIIEFFE